MVKKVTVFRAQNGYVLKKDHLSYDEVPVIAKDMKEVRKELEKIFGENNG